MTKFLLVVVTIFLVVASSNAVFVTLPKRDILRGRLEAKRFPADIVVINKMIDDIADTKREVLGMAIIIELLLGYYVQNIELSRAKRIDKELARHALTEVFLGDDYTALIEIGNYRLLNR